MSTAIPTYINGVVRGRTQTDHGFTVKKLFSTRKRQQQAPVLIAFGWVPTFLSATKYRLWELQFDKQYNEWEDKRSFVEDKDCQHGEPPARAEVNGADKGLAVVAGAYTATTTWLGALTRVGVQAAIASILMTASKPLSDSTVVNWDTYPRIHQKYCGDLCEKLFLPRVIASLMGPATRPEDVALWEVEVSPLAAAQDSLKRHIIIASANVIVTLSLHYLRFGDGEDPSFRSTGRKQAIFKFLTTGSLVEAPDAMIQAADRERAWMNFSNVRYNTLVAEVLNLAGCAIGAAAGRLIGGGRAEYWGEYVGAAVATSVSGVLIVNYAVKQKKNLGIE